MAIESALGRAIPREKAPPGTKRKKVVKGVADLLGVDLPVKVVIKEVPAKIDYTNNPFFRIDHLFSRLKQTEGVVKARGLLRETQGFSKDVHDQNKAQAVMPITGIAIIGLIQGPPKAVHPIINSMKRDELTLGDWSGKDRDEISCIQALDPEIKFELRASLPGNKKHVGLNIVLSEQAVAVLAKSPDLPALEPPPDLESAKK